MWASGFWKVGTWRAGTWQDDEEAPQLPASLGGFAPQRKRVRVNDDPEEIPEAISAAEITRIQSEFLSGALAHDLITRAHKRKARAEEEALLLIL